MEYKKKLLRKENEVRALGECREKLEERLLQERDQKHDQITSLLDEIETRKLEVSKVIQIFKH